VLQRLDTNVLTRKLLADPAKKQFYLAQVKAVAATAVNPGFLNAKLEAYYGVMRNAVWDVDGDQPISYVMTIDEMRSDATAVSRVISALFVFFAATALLLGALGVYGLTAHAVARRTREIGLRMALGARRIDVAGWVVRQALPLVLVGLAVGVGLSLALSRVLASQLFGVATYDALTLGSVALALALAAALATWVPARRASRVDPAVALRAE